MRRAGFLVLATAIVAAIATSSAPAVNPPSGFSVKNIATGIKQAVSIDWGPSGELYVGTKKGEVWVVDPTGSSKRRILDIRSHVNTYSDRGLEGIAVDNDFASNHYLWIVYVRAPSGKTGSHGAMTSRLSRVTVHGDGSTSGETVVLGKANTAPCPKPANSVDCIGAEGPSHMVGTVRSASDGTLWVGSGDGSRFDKLDTRSERAQNEKSLNGKILHVTRSGRGLPGHPFCKPHGGKDDLTRVCAKVYAKGLRNPYRFNFRPGGGLIAGDVGWATREELDLISAGRNYGWPCYEGGKGTRYGAKEPTWRHKGFCDGSHGMYSLEGTSRAARPPVYDYRHTRSVAIIGGPRFPGGSGYPGQYKGRIFFADFPTKVISTWDPDDHKARSFATDVGCVDLELAPNGHLVCVDIGREEIREFVP